MVLGLNGLCCWIGSGWCVEPTDRLPKLGNKYGLEFGDGVQGKPSKGKQGPPGGTGDRNVLLGGGDAQHGHGIHSKGEKRVKLAGGAGQGKNGVGLSQQVPGQIGGQDACGVHGRPQLADAYDIGRGVHASAKMPETRPAIMDAMSGVTTGPQGTCEERRAWLLDWFGRLRDRFRTVRVCCGDWRRVCESESVTTRLGLTGIFFDPPYGHGAGRDMDLYACDSGDVAADVRAYCLERGSDPKMRIVLAGYAGEGHEELEQHGWECVPWKAQGGYGNRSKRGKDNAAKERLWVSPHCERETGGLFE